MAESTNPTGQPSYANRPDSSGWLGQAAAWVAIVAGVVFVVAVIFFSGFFLGARAGDGDRYAGHMRPGGMMGTCPMMSGTQ